jgi:3-hydroxyacyl-CoA dehydrogenase/enoyl-CoA hydratase/3-hydroxybutyryl-CoA epimerase
MDNTGESLHFRSETDQDNIVWLSFDKMETGTNVFSQEVLEELDRLLQGIAAQQPRGLVILSGKPNGFIAGADIKSFTRVRNEQDAMAFLQRGQEVFSRLAACTFPTVAMIHGFCLGGEVRLGIHPGWGGSARMVPLIGAIKAMDLILTGRSIDGRAAKRFGLVDCVAPERHLREAARRLVIEQPAPHRAGFLDRLSNHALVRPLLARVFRRQVGKRASKRHYPAPYAVIDIWQRHAGNQPRMLQAEAESLARLITGATARNLIRVYFLMERLKSLGKASTWRPAHVHVIGAGTMGGDIASWCALRGFRVSLQDQAPERIAPALARAHTLFRRKLKHPRKVQAAMDRLMPDHRGYGVSRADIVIEAIFEDAEVKRSLYRDIEPRMKDDAMLATNTSSIPLEELTESLSRPGRLVGLHFFNPVAKMQLVEIVHGQNTDGEVANRAMAFTRQIDRLPLPVSSTPGFLVNRILMPYLMEAVVLESEGVPATLIDRAATDFGMPMGPVELADTVGLDICLHVAGILGRHFNAEVPQRLQKLVADGNLGKKSGQGFYRYRKGKAIRPRTGTGNWNMEDITNRLVLRLLNEAVRCLREQVVEDPELLDAGMVFGTGFAPFRGGPMNHVDAIGAQELLGLLEKEKQLRGERFKPDQGWESLITSTEGNT